MSSNSIDRVFVLGASSWLGYLLVDKLTNTSTNVAGTVYKTKPLFDEKIKIFTLNNTSLEKNEDIIREFKPTIIVNFLRGEDEDGYKLHLKFIELSKEYSIHYIYASSVLALDGYKNVELLESLEANSISPYGIFKANCERALYDSSISWSIIRFASVQGWVPHKVTRNQSFIEKLIAGITIDVDTGVFQNRILASLLITGIVDIINDKITGVIHFGATDFSEEHIFLKKQAELFGFNPKLVKASQHHRDVNLVAVPKIMYELYDNKYKVNENDTLCDLLKIKAFNNMINNS